MKVTLFLIFLSQAVFATSLYDFELKSENGDKLSLDKFKGKSLLIVNIATKCGYTPQLDDLEKLYEKYQSRDFVILGVPSNDFGGQTPESSKDAAKFCRLKYGVSFPITKKVVVKGEKKVDLMKYITSKVSRGYEIGWNFEKFLFDKKGNFVQSYKSKIEPLSEGLIKDIEKTL